jgi:hypothetical protein
LGRNTLKRDLRAGLARSNHQSQHQNGQLKMLHHRQSPSKNPATIKGAFAAYFGTGCGNPFTSTDTTSDPAMRSLEISS